jgi:hypothetical protein
MTWFPSPMGKKSRSKNEFLFYRSDSKQASRLRGMNVMPPRHLASAGDGIAKAVTAMVAAVANANTAFFIPKALRVGSFLRDLTPTGG